MNWVIIFGIVIGYWKLGFVICDCGLERGNKVGDWDLRLDIGDLISGMFIRMEFLELGFDFGLGSRLEIGIEIGIQVKILLILMFI